MFLINKRAKCEAHIKSAYARDRASWTRQSILYMQLSLLVILGWERIIRIRQPLLSIAVCLGTPLLLVYSLVVAVLSQTPKPGNYYELKDHGVILAVSAMKSFRDGINNMNTWLLFIQNCCSTGVELTVHNASLHCTFKTNLTSLPNLLRRLPPF